MTSEELKYKKLSRLVLLIITLLTLYFLSLFFKIDVNPKLSVKPDFKFDYDYEQFFPEADDDLRYFNEYRDKFESDNDFLLLGLSNHKGVFKRSFLNKVDSLTKDLEQLESVSLVLSPTNIKYQIINPLKGITESLYLDLNGNLKKDSVNVFKHSGLVNTIFTETGPFVSILIKTEDLLSREKSIVLLNQIEELKKKYDFDEFHLGGRIVAQTYYIKRMGKEMGVFMSASTVLIIVFLWFAFRSWWGIVIPVVVVLMSILWTMAFMTLSGKPFDMLTTLLPTIIFVVGMSDVIHILSKYLEELRKGKAKFESLKTAFKEVGIATFLTSFTTAVGFYTLLFANIMPIKDFGWFVGGGVFISYIVAFTLFPSVLINVKTPELAQKNALNKTWDRSLTNWYSWVIRKRKPILIGSVVTITISIILISRVELNNFLLEDLNSDDPVKQDMFFFEDNFSGVRPFEMEITLPDGQKLWTKKTLNDLNIIEQYLDTSYNVGALTSPLTLLKTLNQIDRGGKARFYRFPKSDQQLEKLIKRIVQNKDEKEISDQLDAFIHNESEIRISGKIPDWGAKQIDFLNKQFMSAMNSINIKEKYSLRITGTADLIDKNNSYLSKTMMYGLLVAFGVIGIIMAIMFRSFYLMVVSWVVNLIPLLLIGAVMGIFKIDLRISTSLIFTVSFGIAVDDTIHFLSRYRMERKQGKSNPYAVKRTFISTGKAIIMTSIMLCAGFLTLILSDFGGTYYIGLLVTLTLFFAVITDMLLLPILLLYWRRKSSF